MNKKYYDEFPKLSKNHPLPKKGDIWLAKFPYNTKGNMEKLRPVLVSHEIDDEYIVRGFTTNKKRGEEINEKYKKYFPKTSYITKLYKRITLDKFYKRIYASKEK